MATMNISLPDGLRSFVETQVAARGYGTSSEYVRDLIRQAQERARLQALVEEGIASGRGSDLNDEYFSRLRARIVDADSAKE